MTFSLFKCAICATFLPLAPLSAQAAVVTHNDTFTAFQTLGFGVSGTSTLTLGPSWLEITAKASAGDGNMTISNQTTVSASYEDSLTLDQAKMARITMNEALMFSSHQSTYYEGASLKTSLSVGSLSLNGERSAGGTMKTFTVPTGLVRTRHLEQVTATSNPTQLVGDGRSIPGASFSVGTNSQTKTNHVLTSLTGFLWAEHEATGTRRQTLITNPFGDLTRGFDLGLEGVWNIGFSNAQVTAVGETYIRRGAGGVAEFRLGVGCGDAGDPSDNGTFCLGEDQWISPVGFGSDILLNRNTYRLASDRNLNLGSITVTANPGPTPVPVPASGALMLTLMGAGALARRRR